MMKLYEIMEQATNLIRDPNKHTQCAFARDNEHYSVKSYDAHAVCWCIQGAINKVSGYPQHTDDLGQKVADAFRSWHGEGIIEFNDSHNHDQSISKFDEFTQYLKEKDM